MAHAKIAAARLRPGDRVLSSLNRPIEIVSVEHVAGVVEVCTEHKVQVVSPDTLYARISKRV